MQQAGQGLVKKSKEHVLQVPWSFLPMYRQEVAMTHSPGLQAGAPSHYEAHSLDVLVHPTPDDIRSQ